MAYLILSAAVFCDFVQFILVWFGIGIVGTVVNPFITFAADWVFTWIYYFHGVKVGGIKYIITLATGGILETFTTGGLPLLTLQQIVIILFVWAEERAEKIAPGAVGAIKKMAGEAAEKPQGTSGPAETK